MLFVVALVAAANSAPSLAHGGDPKFDSEVTSITPVPYGLTASVPGAGSHLQIGNRTGSTVVIKGYEGEPYARILANGTVQVNTKSPAWYLNRDAMGNVDVPKEATAKAKPVWQTQDSTGSWQWHDHRIHWMGMGVPRQVSDTSKRTLVLPWSVPLLVGGKPVTVNGKLWWVGQPSEFPKAAIFAFVFVGLLSVAIGFALIRRRRQSAKSQG